MFTKWLWVVILVQLEKHVIVHANWNSILSSISFCTGKRCHFDSSRGVISTRTYLLRSLLLLVFSVSPFKLDQNKNQNRPIDKVQNLGNERRYIYKDPRQNSGQRNISYTRYPKKCFTQIYRDLYGEAMLVLTWMSSNMADGNQKKTSVTEFC